MDEKYVEKRKLFRNRKNGCFGGPGLCGMYKMHVYFFIRQNIVDFRVLYENYQNHQILLNKHKNKYIHICKIV